MFIGITGLYCSGKDSIADILVKKGFGHLSLSDVVRKEMKKANIQITRENLIRFANKMRCEQGETILAKKIVEEIEKNSLNNLVITSIRSPTEVKELEKLNNFFLVSVDAPLKIRFKRAQLRNRENDPKTLKEFLKKENFERYGKKNQQNIEPVLKKAKIHLINDQTEERLMEKVENLLENLKKNVKRPSWDEYFMKMASLIAERSTCFRHNVGAVIVREKRVLTTGYNGAVSGAEDCLKLGCRKDSLKLETGFGSEECRAVHAEQNAIIQAAIHGLSIKGAKMYLTTLPCRMCAKEIVNAGIKEVITYSNYPGAKGSIEFLKKNGVEIKKVLRPNSAIRFKD